MNWHFVFVFVFVLALILGNYESYCVGIKAEPCMTIIRNTEDIRKCNYEREGNNCENTSGQNIWLSCEIIFHWSFNPSENQIISFIKPHNVK